ncbi:MAG: nitronate monooxygenase [Flavobacteriales bacterium]|nr:MAG: nitronate monooxygenase [Flavobacteriales bacterium]
MKNRVTELFGIKYPLIQAGMVWCAPWELASVVSNAGGLGIIGAASMYPDVLRIHIQQCKKATDNSFAVNIPLLYPEVGKLMEIIVEEGVKIVFTSAGNPKVWTSFLKEKGVTVVHVVSSVKFAKKAEEVGVDAVVAEGFEAGGHNGREETTTMCLIPAIKQAISVPLIAAGGIATGETMLASMVLGAEGVQIGSRFAASKESSAHVNFKNAIVQAAEGDTKLTMKKLIPVRLIKNKFFQQVQVAENEGASMDELVQLLGSARAKKGMFEGDMDEGELEIGQVSAIINEIKPAAQIVNEIIEEYEEARQNLLSETFEIQG